MAWEPAGRVSTVPSVISLLSIIIYGTDLLGFLNFLVGLTVPGYVACFLLPQLEPHVGKFMDTLKKFWFVPAAALGVLLVLRLVTGFFSAISLWNSYYFYGSFFEAMSYTSMNFFHFLLNVLSIGGSLLLCCWMVWPDGLPEAWFNTNPAQTSAGTEGYQPASGVQQQNADAIAANELQFSLVGHILLLLFSFGIWQYIWIYRTTKALNRVPGEGHRNPVTKLLLCMFVPFYYIYWIYKSCQRIDKLAGYRSVSSDISTLCLILTFLIGIVPPIIMQDKMNAIAATVLGGTSMAGGSGTVVGTIVGAFVIGVINDGMTMCGVSEFWQKIIRGVVIILAVVIDQTQRNLQAKMALQARNEAK